MFAKPCPYCTTQMARPTRDHILSIAKIRQLPLPDEAKAKLARMKIVVCHSCNHAKSCRTLLEWYDHLVEKRDRRYRHVLRGYFDTAEEAHAAYCRAAEQMHGEFRRLR